MCKECDNIFTVSDPWFNTEQGIYSCVDNEGKQYYAVAVGDPPYDIDIKYCPWCGRKLLGEDAE